MDKSFKRNLAEMIAYMGSNGLQLQPYPSVVLNHKPQEGESLFHNTGHYEPVTQTITLNTHDRHPKDILRTCAHELIHHNQNLRGDLDQARMMEAGDGQYTQNNEYLREIEREAYERSALMFRDFTDGKRYKK